MIKLQFACFLITGFILVRYTRLSRICPTANTSAAFRLLLCVSFIETIFDMVTAYSVNSHSVPLRLNDLFHCLFLLSIDALMYCAYVYFLSSLPNVKSYKWNRRIVRVLFILNMVVVTLTMPLLEYAQGKSTAYSIGVPVYACFVMALFYVILLASMLVSNWSKASGPQRENSITIILAMGLVAIVQFIFPETLITALVPAFISMASYVNQEDPLRLKYNMEKEQLRKELNSINESITSRQDDPSINYVIDVDVVGQDAPLQLNCANVLFVESDRNYVNIKMLEDGVLKELQLRDTMKSFEERVLYRTDLMRVHRAFIINISKVCHVEGNLVTLDGCERRIPVSRSYRRDFMDIIS